MVKCQGKEESTLLVKAHIDTMGSQSSILDYHFPLGKNACLCVGSKTDYKDLNIGPLKGMGVEVSGNRATRVVFDVPKMFSEPICETASCLTNVENVTDFTTNAVDKVPGFTSV